MEVQIRKLENEVLALRAKDISDRKSYQLAIQSQQTNTNLENRLDVVSNFIYKNPIYYIFSFYILYIADRQVVLMVHENGEKYSNLVLNFEP